MVDATGYECSVCHAVVGILDLNGHTKGHQDDPATADQPLTYDEVTISTKGGDDDGEAGE